MNCIIFLYENFPHIFHEQLINDYKELKENSETLYSKGIAKSLDENNICPFDISKFKAEMLTSYVVSLKRDNGSYYSVSYYEGKKLAFQYLIEESGNQLHPDIMKNLIQF